MSGVARATPLVAAVALLLAGLVLGAGLQGQGSAAAAGTSAGSGSSLLVVEHGRFQIVEVKNLTLLGPAAGMDLPAVFLLDREQGRTWYCTLSGGQGQAGIVWVPCRFSGPAGAP